MTRHQISQGVLLAAALIVTICLLAIAAQMSKRMRSAARVAPLKIAMSGAYPPFNYFDDQNRLVGFDVDIAREVARRVGRKAELVTTAWDGIIAGLLAKKHDLIIGSMAITPERQKSVSFSDPYYTSGAQLFVRKDSSTRGPRDLRGKVVGVTLGTTYEQAVRKIEGIKRVVTYSGVPDMYLEMDNKHLDAFVTDRLVGLYGIQKANRDFVLAGEPLYREVIAIALRQQDTALLASVNEALAAMKADGTYAEISTKWFGRDISVAED